MLKNGLKKWKLDDLNFKIQVAQSFDFKYIYIKYVTEKTNFFVLNIYDCGLLKNCCLIILISTMCNMIYVISYLTQDILITAVEVVDQSSCSY